jgi:hypothetical protein
MEVNYLTALVSFMMVLMIAGTSSILPSNKNQKKMSLSILEQQNKWVGMWVTADGYIRQELLVNGRYDEARGNKKSAYTGRYEITGTHIKYWDDSGFTATGDFSGNDTLYHGGYVFYREKQPRGKQEMKHHK